MLGLGRSNLVVATGTALSRITGLARIIIFGVIIGQTALADAFDAANNAPNSMYELLIGGVLAASLVPLFTSLLIALSLYPPSVVGMYPVANFLLPN